MEIDAGKRLTAPTLGQLLGQLRAGRILYHPVLIAANEEACEALSAEAPEARTWIPSVTVTIERFPGSFGRLVDNPCLVVERPRPRAAGIRLSVGRSRQCEYRIGDKSVSGIHAVITLDEAESEYKLVDTMSRNGTFLDGNRLEADVPTAVWSGALLGFGQPVFCFLEPSELRKLATLVREA